MLWATGAWELIEPATPEQKQLVNVVEEMAIASGLPKPRIWIVPDADPNAFATGRDAADGQHRGDRRTARGAVAATSCRRSWRTRWPTCATWTSG